MVIAELPGDDLVLCQITRRSRPDSHAISLAIGDFESGSLHRESFVRCGRIFTADQTIILRRAGRVTAVKRRQVIDAVISLLRSGR